MKIASAMNLLFIEQEKQNNGGHAKHMLHFFVC